MDSMVEPENPRSEVIGRVGSSERGLRVFPPLRHRTHQSSVPEKIAAMPQRRFQNSCFPLSDFEERGVLTLESVQVNRVKWKERL